MLKFSDTFRDNRSKHFQQLLNQLEQCYRGCFEYLQKSTFSFDSVLNSEDSKTHFGSLLWFIHGTHLSKHCELIGALMRSSNSEEFQVFALAGRAIIEQAAILRHCNAKVRALAKEASEKPKEGINYDVEMFRLLDLTWRGSRFAMGQYKRRKTPEGYTVIQQTEGSREVLTSLNVMTAIDSWGRELHGIGDTYQFFCELVHPNLGSNMLQYRNDSPILGREQGFHVGGQSKKGCAVEILADAILFLEPAHRTAMKEIAFFYAAAQSKMPRAAPLSMKALADRWQR